MQVQTLFRNQIDIRVFTFFVEHPIQKHKIIDIQKYLVIPTENLKNSLKHFSNLKIIHLTTKTAQLVKTEKINDMILIYESFKEHLYNLNRTPRKCGKHRHMFESKSKDMKPITLTDGAKWCWSCTKWIAPKN